MNLQQSQTSIVEHADARKEAEIPLHGRWLDIARVGWIVLTLLILTLNVAMIPRYYAVLQANCQTGPQCFSLELNAYDRQFLHQFGLSLGFVAAYQVILDTVAVLVCCALGALIFWRKSADRMALFCAFMLVLFGGVALPNILQDALMPVSPAWFALIGTLELLGQTSFMIFFFLFPSGRFVPRWTRWIVPCIVLYWIYTIFFDNGLNNGSMWSPLVYIAFLLCIVGVQVYRYRRVSTSRERQQTKWVVFGLSIAIVGFVLTVVPEHTFLPPALQQSSVLQTFVVGTLIYGFLLLIPISIAIAVLRSQLYDIDVVINKALVYGSLTALLTAVYAGLVLGLQALLGGLLHQTSTIALVVSTLIIAALFQPLRRRLQQIIDRRFYRRKYDAARTLETFSATLRQEVDLATLSEHLVKVVQETMQPASVSLWLRPQAQERIPGRTTPAVSSESEARDEL
jgi:lipoprotein signal peptidase